MVMDARFERGIPDKPDQFGRLFVRAPGQPRTGSPAHIRL